MLAVQILSLLAVALPALASHDDTFFGLDKRSMQREASARIALARARAAREAKRSIETDSDNLATRNFEEAYAAVGLNRRDFDDHMESSVLSKRSQPRFRCTVGRERNAQANADARCVRNYRNRVTYDPRVAIVKCNQVCTITCPSGYTTQTCDSATVCVKNVDKCRGRICPRSANGVSGCANGRCTLQCTTRGYTLNGGHNACIALGSDPNNCGREGNKCAASYDQKYAATCVFGGCSLNCPRGFKAGINRRRQKTCVKA